MNQFNNKVIWLTGLPCSGKTTLALAFEKELSRRDLVVKVLDGDVVRRELCADLGFSPEDRKENIRRVRDLAKRLVDSGTFVIVALISPYRDDRDQARAVFKAGQFVEVYVKTALATCIQRDVKGMYKKAQAGLIQHFTGISAPYEEPLNPEIVIDAEFRSIEDCVQTLLAHVVEEIKIKIGQNNKK